MQDEKNTINLNSKFIGVDRNLGDFYLWSLGDLMSNTTRGMLAEYLVRCSIGLDSEPVLEWDHVDIRTRRGAIEVKFSGYLQSWPTQKPGKPKFDIKKRRWAWDAIENKWMETPEAKRHAKLYVFCLHAEMERECANPLDTSQWRFWIIATTWLDRVLGEQSSVGLSTLNREHQSIGFDELGTQLTDMLANDSWVMPHG
jgi:hypothetical protein